MTSKQQCACGCGERTKLYRGKPNRFITGHNAIGRKSTRVLHVVNPRTGCWDWIAYRNRDGYGLKADGYKLHLAHRWMYEKVRGPIPDGQELDHLCRNRGCVNPDHLEPVTHKENCHRGARMKLGPASVASIRQRYAAGNITQQRLADEFGVQQAAISKAILGRRWD